MPASCPVITVHIITFDSIDLVPTKKQFKSEFDKSIDLLPQDNNVIKSLRSWNYSFLAHVVFKY